jgi:hypothetical protein
LFIRQYPNRVPGLVDHILEGLWKPGKLALDDLSTDRMDTPCVTPQSRIQARLEDNKLGVYVVFASLSKQVAPETAVKASAVNDGGTP